MVNGYCASTSATSNGNYSGTTTSVLHLNSIPDSGYGYKFRCVMDGNNGELTKIRSETSGVFNTQCENRANWSSGTVPANNTDVIISSGTLTLNANTTIRNLVLTPGVSFTPIPVLHSPLNTNQESAPAYFFLV